MSDELIRPLAHWKLFSFEQSNPDGPGQGDVPALLRRVADTVESLGHIEVMDITFQSLPTADENDLHMAVYYYGEDRTEPKFTTDSNWTEQGEADKLNRG